MNIEEMPRCPKNAAHRVYQDNELPPQALIIRSSQSDYPLRRVQTVRETPPWWCAVCNVRLTEPPMPS